MSGFGWEQKTFNLTKMFVCVYMQHLFSYLENLTLCSLEIVTMLQNASAFASTYTAEDLIIPFFSLLFKDGRTHSVFQKNADEKIFLQHLFRARLCIFVCVQCSISH